MLGGASWFTNFSRILQTFWVLFSFFSFLFFSFFFFSGGDNNKISKYSKIFAVVAHK